jgi:hypothetical protein
MYIIKIACTGKMKSNFIFNYKETERERDGRMEE